MRLEDIYYFSVKKRQHPLLFDYALGVVELSSKNPHDKVEIERRMELLTRSQGTEHIRQCGNFLAELGAFDYLSRQGLAPHWVRESEQPNPDMEYVLANKQVPVEVKHLNSPRREHEALASGRVYGGSVDSQYYLKLQRKVSDFIDSARRKFISFNQRHGRKNDSSGTLYLFFSKSIDASILDSVEEARTMEEHIRDIAEPLLGKDIELILVDIDTLVN